MPSSNDYRKDAKMAMISQFLGFMLDAYDMALVLVMAPILVKIFISPKGSAAWQYIVIVFTYSITMAARRSVRRCSDATPTRLAEGFYWCSPSGGWA